MKERLREQIGRVLEEYAAQAVPDDLDLWPAIRGQLQQRRRRSRWVPTLPTRPLGWAFLALALFLFLATGAYAVGGPAVSQVFQRFWRPLEEAGLAHELDLSQTLEGYTVTLERTYADGNRIVVGFTVTEPPDISKSPPGVTVVGRRPYATNLTLTDDRGTVYPGRFGESTDSSGTGGTSLPPGVSAHLVTFDASAIQRMPEKSVFRFEVYLSVPSRKSPLGPFAFKFTIPTAPTRLVEVNQTIEAAGGTITLQQLVLSPTETRATLCFNLLENEGLVLVSKVTLDTQVQQVATAAIGKYGKQRCWSYSFAPLYEERGEWILSVQQLEWRGWDPPVKDQTIKRVVGPWSFRFVVP